MVDITKFPQFELYLLTLRLLMLKDQLVPDGCDMRCIDSTIINRAYYSSYLYCELWLDFVKNFRPISLNDFSNKKHRVSEHVQVRDALYDFGESLIHDNLVKLSQLRKKADYEPFMDLTSKDVSDAIMYMDKIFNHLKFE